MKASGEIRGKWRILIDVGWWMSVSMLVLLAGLVACDSCPLRPLVDLSPLRTIEQAVRPNTDARGERLCAEHGGYEGYAPAGVRGAWLLCFDGSEFRTFHTGPVDRWVRQVGPEETL